MDNDTSKIKRSALEWLVIGFTIIVALIISFIILRGIWYRYHSLNLSFDLVSDIIILIIGFLFVYIVLFFLHKNFAYRSFFAFLGIIGVLGILAVALFWHNVAGGNFTFIERTLYNRWGFFWIWLSCLGFGWLLFNWNFGKKLSTGAMGVYFLSVIVYNLVYMKYYMAGFGVFGLAIAIAGYRNILYILMNALLFFWIINIFVFMQQGYITWYVKPSNSSRVNSFIDIVTLNPEEYIYRVDYPDLFWDIIYFNLFLYFLVFFLACLAVYNCFPEKMFYKFFRENIAFIKS